MAIYVASDLHLDEDDGSHLFRDDRQGERLAALCRRATEERAELVLLGDTFDLTSMTPPPRGLERFARVLRVRLPHRRHRDLRELLQALARSNPHGLDALRAHAERAPLTIVPGNHDWRLGDRRAPEALAAAGLSRARVEACAVRQVAGRTVAMQHGHLFDPSNARPGGEGEVITQVMHQAIIPYLHQKPSRRHVKMSPGRLAALRPEEFAIPVLERWLEPGDFDRLFRATIRLLADNRVVPRPIAWARRFVSPERARRRILEADGLWQRAGATALAVLAGERRLPLGAPQPDVLVLGHTHVLDWAVLGARRRRPDRLYVNLGTWTERAYDASSPPDTSLPVLRIDDEGGSLRVSLSDLSRGEEGELQRFEVSAERKGAATGTRPRHERTPPPGARPRGPGSPVARRAPPAAQGAGAPVSPDRP
ncbi:MAG TPA: metallophosphoesterase [Anaeromyxobacter sp.]